MKKTSEQQTNRGQIRLTSPNPTTLTTIDQYYQLLGTFDNGVARNFSINPDGTLTCLKAGPYLVNGVSDLEVDKACKITYGLHINDTLVDIAQTPHDFSSANKTSNISITGIVPLNVGDEITIWARSDTATTEITVNTLFVTFWGGY